MLLVSCVSPVELARHQLFIAERLRNSVFSSSPSLLT